MDIITRPVFDRVGLKLPANAKDLLRIGSLKIYDIIQLMVSTVNAVVSANDANIDKEEEFLATLSEIINNWATNFEESIQTLIQEGILDEFTIADGSITSAKLSSEVLGGLFKSYVVYSPGDDGNTYVGADNKAGSEFVLALTDFADVVHFVSLQPLANNIQVEIDNKRGAVFTDNNNGFKELCIVPFATQTDGGLMLAADKKKLDGIYLDASKNVLHIAGKAYQLTPYEEEEGVEYEYGDLTILSNGFLYVDSEGYAANISAEGGKVYPDIVFAMTATPTGGGLRNPVTITANYHYDRTTGTMVTTYVNGDYVTEGLEISFTKVSLASNTTLDSAGIVTKSTASSSGSISTVAVVKVSASMNGKTLADGDDTQANAYQDAASVTVKNLQIGSSAITGSTAYFDVVKTSGVTVDSTTVASSETWFTVTNVVVGQKYVRIYYNVNANSVSASRTAQITANTSLGNSTILANITQAAGVSSGYYGSSSSVPASVSEIQAGTSFALVDGTEVVAEEGYPYAWIAIPTGVTATVTAKNEGGAGEDITDLLFQDEGVSGYVIYYMSLDGFLLDATEFTINV